MQKPDYILLIDDDPLTNYVNKTFLQQKRAAKEVFTAENVEDAFAIIHEIEAKAESPEKKLCIFLDLDMPRLNGYEFLEELKRGKIDLKVEVYILSILFEWEEKKHLAPYPVAKFIAKPLSCQKWAEITSDHEPVYFNQAW